MNCLNSNNNYKLYASCCNKYICCHICHNRENDHRLRKSKDIKHILCTKCDTINENLEDKCKSCNSKYSKHFCKECNIYNDSDTGLYHCKICKKCYYTSEESLVHCDKCNRCFNNKAILKHKCNIIEGVDKCQICLDKIFSANEKTILLRCSHLIHESCLNNLKLYNINEIVKCTICNMSVQNSKKYEDEYDKRVLECPVNEPRCKWKTEYLCFDCHDKNTTKYHYNYHKCLECNSYNTTSLNTLKVS